MVVVLVRSFAFVTHFFFFSSTLGIGWEMWRTSTALCVSLVVLSSLVSGSPSCEGGTLALSGAGTASAGFDEATVTFTVKAFHSSSMSKARAACASTATRTIASVLRLDVPERNISTQHVRMNPEYDYNTKRSGSTPTLRGYSVTNSLQVTVGDFAKLADVIDEATNAAGSDLASLSGPNFRLSAELQRELQRVARVRAIEEIKEEAQRVAIAAGCTIGKLSYLSDRPVSGGSGSTGNTHHFAKARMYSMAAAESDMATPIMVSVLLCIVPGAVLCSTCVLWLRLH